MLVNGFYYALLYLHRQLNAFCSLSSLSCIHYLGTGRCSFARFFWFVAWWSSFYVALDILTLLFWQYQNNPTLTTFSLREPGEKIPFPAVFLCPAQPLNEQRLAEYGNRSGLNMPPEQIQQCLWNYLVLGKMYNISAEDCSVLEQKWRNVKPRKLLLRVEEVLQDCSYGGSDFACDLLFKIEPTELGLCFVFNNYVLLNIGRDRGDLHIAQLHTLEEIQASWELSFRLTSAANGARFYLKHNIELINLREEPTYVHDEKQFGGFLFDTLSFECSMGVRHLSIRQRRCAYHDEIPDHMDAIFNPPIYDYSVCANYCHAAQFLKECSCVPYFYERLVKEINWPLCNSSSWGCLEQHRRAIRISPCNHCPRSCLGAVHYITSVRQRSREEDAKFTIGMGSWPIDMMRNNVIFGRLELALSYGGILGLFLGVSCVTLIEFFYFMCVHFFCFFKRNKLSLQEQLRVYSEHPPQVNLSLSWPMGRHHMARVAASRISTTT